jgi:hypothetical protein
MAGHLLVVMLFILSPLLHENDFREQRARLGGWTLDIRKDVFTGRQACRLRRGEVYYERRALVFQLGGRADTSQAAYRIDGGPAYQVAADQVELARLGFELQGEDLFNPSGGVVRVTLARLGAARRVDIAPKLYGPSRRFDVEGLGQALRKARAWCAEADFDRPTDFGGAA